MSVRDLELELARWRGEARSEQSNAVPLTVAEALDFKARGNIPDDLGRSLRLVLHVADERAASQLHERRVAWEPNFHDAPTWRRAGSVAVNIVPLRAPARTAERERSWLEDPAMAAMELEWSRTGAVGGVAVPADYRSFVYKTVIALEAAGRDVTVGSIADSVERWLNPEDARKLRAALEAANG